VDSAFDSCLKGMGFKYAETGHCVTTMGKLFTPAVPSGAVGRLNKLTPGIAGNSGQVVYLHWLGSSHPFIFNWWINRVQVRAGDAASAGWQVTLCDPIWHAGFYSVRCF